jgi:hypothetical protein
MTQTFKTRIGAVVMALCLAGASLPAAAQDNLPVRAINALGMAIAAQGDAALITIRQELKEALVDHIEPYLPEPDASTDRKSAEADAPRQ